MSTTRCLPLTARCGIGLRPPHYRAFADGSPAAGWLEVHSENFFCAGGAPLALLDDLRERYSVSLHGVGLSLGSPPGRAGYEAANAHLAALRTLVDRIDPVLVSEHLSWSAVDGMHFNDLFPLPHTEESLAVVSDRVSVAQEVLGREILVENISAYVEFAHETLSEAEFLDALVRRTGCGILLDINNVQVSSRNLGRNARAFIDALPAAAIAEFHLAGYDWCGGSGEAFLIDTHGREVQDDVWDLYDYALEKIGPRPTLIEWDTDIPALSVLQAEAEKAQRRLDRSWNAGHARAA